MGIRSDIEGFALKDPSLLDNAENSATAATCRFSVFRTWCCSRSRTRWRCGRSAEGPDADGAELDHDRLLSTTRRNEDAAAAPEQSRGPAGYVSMEDGAVGGFVQRGVAAAGGERAVSRWAARAHRPGTRATEASVRGFEALSRADGNLMSGRSRSSASSRCRPPISAASTATPWSPGRTSSSTMPLHRDDGREPKLASSRHHLRRHQGHAGSTGSRRFASQCLREASYATSRPAEHLETAATGRERDTVPGGAHHARRPDMFSRAASTDTYRVAATI